MDSFHIFGLVVAAIVGGALTVLVSCVIGFLGELFHGWTAGREIYLIVSETKHKRRLELLDRLIALEIARKGSLG
jgi:hypothetical protein